MVKADFVTNKMIKLCELLSQYDIMMFSSEARGLKDI